MLSQIVFHPSHVHKYHPNNPGNNNSNKGVIIKIMFQPAYGELKGN